MQAIELFDHEQFGEIRTVVENGEPWFVAKDVAAALGYSNTRDAIGRHCKHAKSLAINTVVKHDGITPFVGKTFVERYVTRGLAVGGV